MKYVLDTNTLIHIVRNSDNWKFIETKYKPFDSINQAYISFASVAELLSIAKQVGWGDGKIKHLKLLFNELEIVTVSAQISDLLLQSYVEIDTYSQGKNQIPLPQGVSARNMGKNDIWIAATAHALQATLITTDKDFNHLHQVFFEVAFIT
jgi:tRNA(fMet)-specific endonuclease VapC